MDLSILVEGEMMAKNNITDIVSKIVDLMTPISSEERKRVVSASLTLLGEDTPTHKKVVEQDGHEDGLGELTNIPARARTWMKQNNITKEQIQNAFHASDGIVEFIAELPGSSNKEKTLNAYVLFGIAKLIETGKLSFDDTSTRDFCKAVGCFDQNNHATYIGDRKNLFSGSKEKGWNLTVPGLKRGAELIKGIEK